MKQIYQIVTQIHRVSCFPYKMNLLQNDMTSRSRRPFVGYYYSDSTKQLKGCVNADSNVPKSRFLFMAISSHFRMIFPWKRISGRDFKAGMQEFPTFSILLSFRKEKQEFWTILALFEDMSPKTWHFLKVCVGLAFCVKSRSVKNYTHQTRFQK